MATKEEIGAALMKADAAGNTEDAKILADAYRSYVDEPEGPSSPEQSFDAFGRGIVHGGSLGFSDEMKAGVGAGLDWVSGTNEEFSENYESLRDSYRQEEADIQEANPVAYGAGVLTSSVLPGAGVAKAGMGAIKGGAAIGAAYGAGEAEETTDLPEEMIKGAAYGAGGGAAGKAVGAAIGGTVNTAGKVLQRGAKGVDDFQSRTMNKVTDRVKTKMQDLLKKEGTDDNLTDKQIDKLGFDEIWDYFDPAEQDQLYKAAGKELTEATSMLGDKGITVGDVAVTGTAYTALGPFAFLAPLAGRAATGAVKKQVYGKVIKEGSKKTESTAENLARKLMDNGTKLKKWAPVFEKAAGRGGAALSSTHYMLQQQDPEYREAFRDIEEPQKKLTRRGYR